MEYRIISRCMAQCFGHLCLLLLFFSESCSSSDRAQAAVNLSPPPPLSALQVHLPGVKWGGKKRGNVEHICQECNLHFITKGRNSKNISHFMPHSQLTRCTQQSVHHMLTGPSFHCQKLGFNPINLNGHFKYSHHFNHIPNKWIKGRYYDRWSFVVVFVCLFVFFILVWIICLLSEIIWMYFSKSPFCN